MSVADLLYSVCIRTGTPLYSQIGNRMWLDTPIDSWNNTTAAVVVQIINDRTIGVCPVHVAQVRFICYGGSERLDAANAVYQALINTLHGANAKTDAGTLYAAFFVSGTPCERNNEDEWAYADALFEVIYTL